MTDKYSYMSVITSEMVKYKLPYRSENAHKGTFGKLFCICGSKNMPGSAWFVINAAIKCGVGSVKACVVPSVYENLSKRISEPTFCVVNEDKDGFMSKDSLEIIFKEIKDCSCIVLGSGLGYTMETKYLVEELIKNSKIPIVLDGDGINIVADNISIIKENKFGLIFTPHPKEMSRLIKIKVEDINSNKMRFAKEFAQEHRVCIALKGKNTVVCDKKGNIYMNTTGNSGMAKGGSGDILSGMIGSFVSQKLSEVNAAVCGVFLHGLVGDKCQEKFSSISMTPTDMINELPSVFKKFER